MIDRHSSVHCLYISIVLWGFFLWFCHVDHRWSWQTFGRATRVCAKCPKSDLLKCWLGHFSNHRREEMRLGPVVKRSIVSQRASCWALDLKTTSSHNGCEQVISLCFKMGECMCKSVNQINSSFITSHSFWKLKLGLNRISICAVLTMVWSWLEWQHVMSNYLRIVVILLCLFRFKLVVTKTIKTIEIYWWVCSLKAKEL